MRILAIGAHPDDIELFCGGTLAKYVQSGHEVTMLHACTGDKGDFSMKPEELSKIRSGETCAAGALIGAKVMSLGYGDGELFYNQETLDVFVDRIRDVAPDVIITHNPEDYHIDHVAVSKLAVDASFLISVPSIRPQTKYTDTVPQVYFMETSTGIGFVPTDYVDITGAFAIKQEMMRCHQSQHRWLMEHDHLDIMEFLEVNAKYRGYQCGVRYAECFIRYITGLRAAPGCFLP